MNNVANSILKFTILVCLLAHIQSNAVASVDTAQVEKNYKYAYTMLEKMLKQKVYDLEIGTFYVENAYHDDSLSFENFHEDIVFLTLMTEAYSRNNRLLYTQGDSATVSKHASLFKVITDSTPIAYRDTIVYHEPFRYNFDDFDGSEDWGNMFVSTLLNTHKGNCHSLPLLYKIISQKLNIESYLALAPNHIYVKLFNDKDGWYNVELTSAEFPIDAWLMASGYIHLNAVQNAVYMDTLNNEKCIAMCILDLAQGYQRRLGTGDAKFILQCCQTALHYFPNYINAMLLQSETYQALLKQKMKSSNHASPQKMVEADPEAKILLQVIEDTVSEIYRLGYRRMPEKMYLDWLATLQTQKDKYTNKNISNFIPSK